MKNSVPPARAYQLSGNTAHPCWMTFFMTKAVPMDFRCSSSSSYRRRCSVCPQKVLPRATMLSHTLHKGELLDRGMVAPAPEPETPRPRLIFTWDTLCYHENHLPMTSLVWLALFKGDEDVLLGCRVAGVRVKASILLSPPWKHNKQIGLLPILLASRVACESMSGKLSTSGATHLVLRLVSDPVLGAFWNWLI